MSCSALSFVIDSYFIICHWFNVLYFSFNFIQTWLCHIGRSCCLTGWRIVGIFSIYLPIYSYNSDFKPNRQRQNRIIITSYLDSCDDVYTLVMVELLLDRRSVLQHILIFLWWRGYWKFRNNNEMHIYNCNRLRDTNLIF